MISAFRILLIVCSISLIDTVQATEPMTWPHPLGPEYNRVSRERNIPLDWDDDSPLNADQQDELWTITELPGLHTPLIFNEKLYALFDFTSPIEETKGGSHYGIISWSIKDRDPEARFTQQISSDLPQRCPQPYLVGDPAWRQLFCLNVTGEVVALDSDLGNTLWTHALFDESVSDNLQAQTVAPLIFEHLLIVTWQVTQNNQNMLHCVALDRRNGLPCWQLKRSLSTKVLGSPTPAVLNHQVVLAIPGEEGSVELLQIRTGRFVAKLESSGKSQTIHELLYQDGKLLALSSTEINPTMKSWGIDVWRLVESESSQSSTALKTPQKLAHFDLQSSEMATALLHGDAVFAANSAGTLEVFSIKQQKRLHELPTAEGTMPHLQWIDDQVLLTTNSGLWQAYSCKNSACELLYTKKVGKQIPFLPAISKKQIYVQHINELTAFGPYDNDDAISQLMIPLTKIAQDETSDKPDSIQIIPAAISLSPGYQQAFQVLLFNDQGHYLRTLDPQELTWNWNGPGEITSEKGILTLPIEINRDSRSILDVEFESFRAESIIRVHSPTKQVIAPSAP
ncbi:outer membrane protein assembly factor BamB family protein [Rubinisphaera italica]|uniref:Outer membrane biogenesis protein BamB n=1 Tax=Rubinisphaera italica TaxID=2527969 RepID=A0A5C5XHD1_9PLAN|nr:PQQ-binding-like beta-propeller repeat protein [Rubinisphaera italica]TWT62380.1 outer membrane biogenesis protein BamB [Rubinisphaera italica]